MEKQEKKSKEGKEGKPRIKAKLVKTVSAVFPKSTKPKESTKLTIAKKEEKRDEKEKKKIEKKKILALPIILIILLIGLIIIIILLFTGYRTCNDELCFKQSLNECKKVIYENDEWKYKILEKKGDACVVEVTSKQIKNVEAEIVERLRGKVMRCYITDTSIMPNEDIDVCHGELKEEILSIMLEKIHEYIIQQIT